MVLVSILLLALFAHFAFSGCPSLADTPKEFRLQLRYIALEYLANPASSKYSKAEILGLISFYEERKSSLTIEDCQKTAPGSSNKIAAILKKKPELATQCSDGKDNDKDGRIDMGDPGCSDESDNSEI